MGIKLQVMAYAAAFMSTTWRGAAQQGFVIYSILDFTCTYMFHGWTLGVAVLDTIWGTTVYGIVGKILEGVRSMQRLQMSEA